MSSAADHRPPAFACEPDESAGLAELPPRSLGDDAHELAVLVLVIATTPRAAITAAAIGLGCGLFAWFLLELIRSLA